MFWLIFGLLFAWFADDLLQFEWSNAFFEPDFSRVVAFCFCLIIVYMKGVFEED